MNIEKITPQIAALYLGQKCDSENGASFYIVSVSLWGVTDGDRLHAPFEGLKLHLRRLESITEEDARELYEAGNGEAWDGDYECTRWLGFDDDFGYANKLGWFIGNPPAWLYLISKGFDLFGLIDKGLAKEIKS